MSQSPMHDVVKKALGRFVDLTTDELEIPCAGLGQTTWKRPEVVRGLEADDCYYFALEKLAVVDEAVARWSNDLTEYPNPDLAIEVDVSPRRSTPCNLRRVASRRNLAVRRRTQAHCHRTPVRKDVRDRRCERILAGPFRRGQSLGARRRSPHRIEVGRARTTGLGLVLNWLLGFRDSEVGDSRYNSVEGEPHDRSSQIRLASLAEVPANKCARADRACACRWARHRLARSQRSHPARGSGRDSSSGRHCPVCRGVERPTLGARPGS